MSTGVLGLGLLGSQIAIKIKKDRDVSVYSDNRDTVYNFVKQNPNIAGYTDINKMLAFMDRPRVIFTAYSTGVESRDAIITLARRLGPLDVIIDCSNEHYETTQFRSDFCAANCTQYLGVGISRDCIMVGGPKKVYNEYKNILNKLSSNVVYLGSDSDAGHFTNMVHNSIEYAILQGISDVFSYCNQDEDIMRFILDKALGTDIDGYIINHCLKLVDMNIISTICNVPQVKNTGLRCSDISLRNNIPIPTMNAALNSRCSANYIESVNASQSENTIIDAKVAVGALRFVYAISIIEGIQLMKTRKVNNNLYIKSWSNGSRIECPLINKDQYKISEETVNFAREFVIKCIQHSIPCPVVQAALTHYDFIHQYKNSMNIISAYFENQSIDIV